MHHVLIVWEVIPESTALEWLAAKLESCEEVDEGPIWCESTTVIVTGFMM